MVLIITFTSCIIVILKLKSIHLGKLDEVLILVKWLLPSTKSITSSFPSCWGFFFSFCIGLFINLTHIPCETLVKISLAPRAQQERAVLYIPCLRNHLHNGIRLSPMYGIVCPKLCPGPLKLTNALLV